MIVLFFFHMEYYLKFKNLSSFKKYLFSDIFFSFISIRNKFYNKHNG